MRLDSELRTRFVSTLAVCLQAKSSSVDCDASFLSVLLASASSKGKLTDTVLYSDDLDIQDRLI